MAQYKAVMNALTEALDTAKDDERAKLRDAVTAYRAKYDHGHYAPLVAALFDAIEASVSDDGHLEDIEVAAAVR